MIIQIYCAVMPMMLSDTMVGVTLTRAAISIFMDFHDYLKNTAAPVGVTLTRLIWYGPVQYLISHVLTVFVIAQDQVQQ